MCVADIIQEKKSSGGTLNGSVECQLGLVNGLAHTYKGAMLGIR